MKSSTMKKYIKHEIHLKGYVINGNKENKENYKNIIDTDRYYFIDILS